MANQVAPTGGLVAGIPLAYGRAAGSDPPTPGPFVRPPPKGSGERAGAAQETLESAAEKVKSYLENAPSDLRFSVDKGSGHLVFQIINSATHEVIRQVPSEEILVMASRLSESSKPDKASGLLLDAEG